MPSALLPSGKVQIPAPLNTTDVGIVAIPVCPKGAIYVWLAVIAWQLPIFLISASCLITYHSAGLVNTVCHKYGYKSFNTKDKSTNNTLVNIITLGSGLHNNHHHDPANYSNKFSKYEFDLPAWIIKNFFMKYDNTQIKT